MASVTEVSLRRCFNSATASPPWKTDEETVRCSSPRVLQFGHGVAAVEDARFIRPALGQRIASIRPRRRRRGRQRPSTGYRGVKRRLQFGHGVAAVEDGGKQDVIDMLKELQFGHGVAAVEDLRTGV